jgi:hypothetical protein
MTDFACQIDETMLGDPLPMTLTLPRPRRPKKKSIEYGPAPKHMVSAVRKELRRLVELPDLDANLGMIHRFAMQADDMLMTLKSPVAVMRQEHEITVPGTQDTPGNIETIGMNFIRQIMAGLAAQQSTVLQSPELLTNAIAAARRDGMTDLAAELEKKLLGSPVDGDRPVIGKMPTVESYLDTPPALPAHLAAKKGKRGKKNPAAGLNGHGHRSRPTTPIGSGT